MGHGGSAFHFTLLQHAKFLLFTANLSLEMTWQTLMNLWTKPIQIDLYDQFAATMKVFLRMEYAIANKPVVGSSVPQGARCPACTPASSSFSGIIVRVSSMLYSAPYICPVTQVCSFPDCGWIFLRVTSKMCRKLGCAFSYGQSVLPHAGPVCCRLHLLTQCGLPK